MLLLRASSNNISRRNSTKLLRKKLGSSEYFIGPPRFKKLYCLRITKIVIVILLQSLWASFPWCLSNHKLQIIITKRFNHTFEFVWDVSFKKKKIVWLFGMVLTLRNRVLVIVLSFTIKNFNRKLFNVESFWQNLMLKCFGVVTPI